MVVLTTVHPLQIVDEDLPETDHDFRIDFIITPIEIIPTCRNGGRPKGIIRDHLTEQKISEIPILEEILYWIQKLSRKYPQLSSSPLAGEGCEGGHLDTLFLVSSLNDFPHESLAYAVISS